MTEPGADDSADDGTVDDSADDDTPDEAIPLQIAGHEDRTPPSERDTDGEDSSTFAFDEAVGVGGNDGVERGEADGVERGEADGVDDGRTVDDDAAETPGGAGEGGVKGGQVDDGVDDEEDVEPVELLVQLAKDGEIDPWDIDIVRVTDTFLEALDERDLRTSGRALFYASVLLRMKSDELFAADEPDSTDVPPWEAPFADEGPMDDDREVPPGFDPIDQLEAEMDRRLERKHARGNPETLDELVRELREAERGTWWKDSRTYDTSESPRGWDRGVQELSYHSGDDFRVDDEPTADDVTHTAHAEDIEAIIEDVVAAVEPHFDRGREEVLYAEVDDAGGSRVMTYLALLFLAHRGHVRLAQDDLFGDLWIQEVTVEADVGEAVAD